MERKVSSLGYMSDPGRIKAHTPTTVKYYDANTADTDPTTANLLSVWNNAVKYLAMPSTLFPPFVVEVLAISLVTWFLVRFIRGRRQNRQIASAMIASVYAPMFPSFARIGAYSHHKRVQRDLGQLLHDRIGSIPTEDVEKAALLFEAGEDVCAAYARVLQEAGTGVWGVVVGVDTLGYSDFSTLHNKGTTVASQGSEGATVGDDGACGGECGAGDGVGGDEEIKEGKIEVVREAVVVVTGAASDGQRRLSGEERKDKETEGKERKGEEREGEERKEGEAGDSGWELIMRDEAEEEVNEKIYEKEENTKVENGEGTLKTDENSERKESEEEKQGGDTSQSPATPTHTTSSSSSCSSSLSSSTTVTSNTFSCASSSPSTSLSPSSTSQQHPPSVPLRWLQYITSMRALIETHPYRYYAYASGHVPRVVSTHDDKNDNHTLLGMHIQLHLQHRHNILAPLLRLFDLNARTDADHDTITFSFLLPRSAQPLLYVYALAGVESSHYHQYADVQLLAGSPPPLKATFDPKSERNHLFGHVRRYYTYTDTTLLANAPPMSTLLTNRLHAVGSATGGDVELLSIYVSDQCREDDLLNGHESVGKEIDSADMAAQRRRNQRDLLGVTTGELQECASVVRVRWRVSPDIDWNRITKFIYGMDDLDEDERILRVAKAIRRIGTLSLHVAEAFSAFKLPSAIHDANMQRRLDTLKRMKKQLSKNK